MEEGVILCKSGNNINVVATGTYDMLQNKLAYYYKIVEQENVRLVSLVGIDIKDIITNQEKINISFEKEFT